MGERGEDMEETNEEARGVSRLDKHFCVLKP